MENKEKQIEEIANDLRVLDLLQHNPKYSIEYQRAIGLYSFGYRKASDVAREIFAEIEKLLKKNELRNYEPCNVESYYSSDLEKDFAELKKKYMESEKGNGN